MTSVALAQVSLLVDTKVSARKLALLTDGLTFFERLGVRIGINPIVTSQHSLTSSCPVSYHIP
jgi:hypothetical protein